MTRNGPDRFHLRRLPKINQEAVSLPSQIPAQPHTMQMKSLRKFGGRILTDPADVFSQNAWDQAEWDDEQEQRAQSLISAQLVHPVDPETVQDLLQNAGAKWDEFYSTHNDNFFMDSSRWTKPLEKWEPYWILPIPA